MSNRASVVRILLIIFQIILFSGCIRIRDELDNRIDVDFLGGQTTIESPDKRVRYKYNRKARKAEIYDRDGIREEVIHYPLKEQ